MHIVIDIEYSISTDLVDGKLELRSTANMRMLMMMQI